MANIFLALPTHDGRIYTSVAQIAYGYAVREETNSVMVVPQQSSLLPGNCNRLYTMCLNNRKEHNIDWFAMLHSDVLPEQFFLNKLIDEAEKHGADMMSAVVAIKNSDGNTSTALASGHDFGQFGRLTMRQLAHPDFPKTFDIDMACDALERLPPPLRVEKPPRVGLLVNTGCMIVRVNREWSDKICFRNLDTIMRDADGVYHSRDLSEDWYFARDVAQHGGKVMATTVVKVEHMGALSFPNYGAWGTVPNDCIEREYVINVPVSIKAGAA